MRILDFHLDLLSLHLSTLTRVCLAKVVARNILCRELTRWHWMSLLVDRALCLLREVLKRTSRLSRPRLLMRDSEILLATRGLCKYFLAICYGHRINLRCSLKGEYDFSRRSVKDSSHAYDQHLLSKIGNPISPRSSVSMGTENRNSASTLPVPPRGFSNLPSPVASDAPSLDVRWSGSSQSGGISPNTKVAWRDYISRRSPSVESSAPSSTMEYEHHSPFSRDGRRKGGTTPHYDELSSLPSRSNRGSYDQSVISDMEGEFSNDESLPSRLFNVRQATPPYLETSKSGTKRRASSPPREHALHTTTSNGDLSQRRTTGHPFTNNLSVNSGYTHGYGSHSAASSISARTTASFSSGAPSIGTSITTASTFDRSPTGLSPKSDLDAFHDKPPVPPGPAAGLPTPSAAQTTHDNGSLESNNPNSRKMSFPTSLSVPKPATAKIGGLYICDCCPKKPKKFDSPEELR